MNLSRSLLSLATFIVIQFAAHSQDAAVLDLSLEAPFISTNPGPEYADDVRPGNMIIGIDRTPKGRLWAAWVGNGDSPNGFFMLGSSDDGGRSWSKPRVVIDPTDLPGMPNRPSGPIHWDGSGVFLIRVSDTSTGAQATGISAVTIRMQLILSGPNRCDLLTVARLTSRRF